MRALLHDGNAGAAAVRAHFVLDALAQRFKAALYDRCAHLLAVEPAGPERGLARRAGRACRANKAGATHSNAR